jgi:hypothetical protein
MTTQIIWCVDGQQEEGPTILKPASQVTLADVKRIWKGPPAIFLFRTFGSFSSFNQVRENKEKEKNLCEYIL